MNDSKPARRVDDKHPGRAVDWSDAPRFNALGIAETWSVTVEAEGRRVLCISHEHYAGVSEAQLDQFQETIRSCAMHLLGFMGANPVIESAAPTVSPAPAAAGIEGLTRYEPVSQYEMGEDIQGDYVKFAEVERLLGTHAGVVATQAAVSEQTAAEIRRTALEEAAKLIETKVDAYVNEHGSYDHTTGATEYPGDGGEWVCEMEELAEEIRNLATKEAAGAEAPHQWISVDERLPAKECLAVYMTPRGKQRMIRAKYAHKFQIEATDDDCETDYNEDDDTFYIKAGWLECIDNWGEYSSCYVTEGIVTHWMPLPAVPASAQGEKGGD